jgi:hypothetical protein
MILAKMGYCEECKDEAICRAIFLSQEMGMLFCADKPVTNLNQFATFPHVRDSSQSPYPNQLLSLQRFVSKIVCPKDLAKMGYCERSEAIGHGNNGN